MTRSLTEFSATSLCWTILVKWQLPSGNYYTWVGPLGTSITYDGADYIGTGEIAEFDKLTETNDDRDARTHIKLKLSAGTILSDDNEDDDVGSPVTLILAALDASGAVQEAVEFNYFIGEVGYLQTVDGNISLDYADVELVSRASLLDRSFSLGLTNAEQLTIDDDDFSLEFVADPELNKIGVGGAYNQVITVYDQYDAAKNDVYGVGNW